MAVLEYSDEVHALRDDHVLCARIREDVRWNWNRLAVVRIIVLIALSMLVPIGNRNFTRQEIRISFSFI